MTMNSDQHSAAEQRISTAVRDFVRVRGRILISPAGELTEGGGSPWPLVSGTDNEAAACLRAGTDYFRAKDLPGADQRISRAVRMLGRRTGNGWLVLEAKSETTEGLR